MLWFLFSVSFVFYNLYYFIHLIILHFVCFFSNSLRCKIKLLIWELLQLCTCIFVWPQLDFLSFEILGFHFRFSQSIFFLVLWFLFGLTCLNCVGWCMCICGWYACLKTVSCLTEASSVPGTSDRLLYLCASAQWLSWKLSSVIASRARGSDVTSFMLL